MSYPYGEYTYLKEIQHNPNECEQIEQAFYTLRSKYARDHLMDEIEVPLGEQFKLLAEAFEIKSYVLDSVTDEYHFMDDIIEALLTPTKES